MTPKLPKKRPTAGHSWYPSKEGAYKKIHVWKKIPQQASTFSAERPKDLTLRNSRKIVKKLFGGACWPPSKKIPVWEKTLTWYGPLGGVPGRWVLQNWYHKPCSPND